MKLSCQVKLYDEWGNVTASVHLYDEPVIEIDLDVEDAMKLIETINANKDYSYTKAFKTFNISPSSKTITFTCKSKSLTFKDDEYDECVKDLLFDYDWYCKPRKQ